MLSKICVASTLCRIKLDDYDHTCAPGEVITPRNQYYSLSDNELVR